MIPLAAQRPMFEANAPMHVPPEIYRCASAAVAFRKGVRPGRAPLRVPRDDSYLRRMHPAVTIDVAHAPQPLEPCSFLSLHVRERVFELR